MAEEKTLQITVDKFYQGFSSLAFQNSLTSFGSAGNASTMTNADVINGEYITQGQGLANLTNGTEADNVTELIQFIMDRATTDNESWAFGTTKLFKISSTAVASGSSISGCTEGESLVNLKGNLLGFYNKASGGDIFKMPLSTETIDANWGTTGTHGNTTPLENAPHPSAKKEDISAFGNGRYLGIYIDETNTLTPQKLDFGNDAEVDDVIFDSGYWWIVVNSGITGTNRTEGQIYLYDGSAIPSTLSDETGVGVQRIGFIYRINGIKYVAYQDLTSTGFIIGFIQGKAITPLVRYNGTLPTFAQKTLYKNTILFLSGGKDVSSLASPGTMADDDSVGTLSWSSVDSAKVEDGTSAFTGFSVGTTHYLKATNFGFAIPNGATINGIKVEIKQLDNGNDATESSVKIVKGGTISGNNKSTGANLPDSLTYVEYGGSTDLWGLSWTASDVNASNFGVVFSVVQSSAVGVDHIRITVYYSEMIASGLVYSAGALVPELPYQLSQIADGGYATVGAIAAPFGTPMVSSTDGASAFRLAQFSGFDTNSSWKSIIFSVSKGRFKAYIDSVVVNTKTLGAGASCALTLESDQNSTTSNTMTVATTNKRRHVFTATGLEAIEDFRVALDFSGGSTTNDCAIREVVINYHLLEN